jgi:hypothetical protein
MNESVLLFFSVSIEICIMMCVCVCVCVRMDECMRAWKLNQRWGVKEHVAYELCGSCNHRIDQVGYEEPCFDLVVPN